MTKQTKKKTNIFDFLSYITYKKKPWSELSEQDHKAFTPYMINRWLSMSPELIGLVNDMQPYTIGQLSKKNIYEFYQSILPPVNIFFKYIKGDKDEKYNKELVEIISRHYEISKRDSIDILDIYWSKNKMALIELLESYGLEEKKINKLIKKNKK